MPKAAQPRAVSNARFALQKILELVQKDKPNV